MTYYWLKEDEFINKVLEDYRNLKYVKRKYLTNENCLLFMNNNYKAIEYIPLEFQTFEICKIAIDNNYFRYVSNQSYKICKYALKYRLQNLEYINNQTYKLCKYAININPDCIGIIYNQTKKLCYLSLKLTNSVLGLIRNPNYKMCKLAIKKKITQNYYEVFKYIPEKYRTEKIIKYALKYDLTSLKYIDNLNDEMIEIAIKYNPQALYYIENPTEELCLKSLKKYGTALEYILNPTYEICLIACNNTNKMLLNVIPLEYRTDEICKIELNKNSYCIKYIPNPTNDMCLKAIINDPFNLKFIKNQTEEMCITALKMNINVIEYVNIKIDLSFLFKKKSVFKEKNCLCPICNESKEYYATYNCNIKHYICLDCLKDLNCYYKCRDINNEYHTINFNVLWINIPDFE